MSAFITSASGHKYLREVLRSNKQLAELTLSFERRRWSGTGGYRLAGEIRALKQLMGRQSIGHHFMHSESLLGATCSCGLIVDSNETAEKFFEAQGHLDMRTGLLATYFATSPERFSADVRPVLYYLCQLCSGKFSATATTDADEARAELVKMRGDHSC